MAALRTDEPMMKGQHVWELERLHFMQKPPDTWHPYSSGKVVGGRTLTLYHAPTPDPPPFSPNKTVGSSPVLACAFTVCNVCVQECFVCHSVCHCHPGVHMTTALSHSPDWLTDWLTETIWNRSSESHRIALQIKSTKWQGRRFTRHRQRAHTHTHAFALFFDLSDQACLLLQNSDSWTHVSFFKGPLPGFYKDQSVDLSSGPTSWELHHVLGDTEGGEPNFAFIAVRRREHYRCRPLVWSGLLLISSIMGKFKIWCFPFVSSTTGHLNGLKNAETILYRTVHLISEMH